MEKTLEIHLAEQREQIAKEIEAKMHTLSSLGPLNDTEGRIFLMGIATAVDMVRGKN